MQSSARGSKRGPFEKEAGMLPLKLEVRSMDFEYIYRKFLLKCISGDRANLQRRQIFLSSKTRYQLLGWGVGWESRLALSN
jgi:hypothetical protein